ncbi:MAG TPA: NUDIX hydrolase [Vineibacter sp.]|nr:NUDIX hydrolase [Vineibacter sp.]
MPRFERPIATVDAALFTLVDGGLRLALGQRDREPYKGQLALFGGYVFTDADEDTAATARRILRDKAGIALSYLEQLYTFSGKVRDPRGWSLSVAYYALVQPDDLRSSGARPVELVPVERVPALPFDHNRIVEAALARLRGKATYSSLPAFLLPPTFTLTQLQEVYERVLGQALDKSSFRRKIEAQGVITPAEAMTRGGRHRPAQLYRLSDRNLAEFDRLIGMA